MRLQVRPAQLKDLGAIESLYRRQLGEGDRPGAATAGAPRRQFASKRLWFLLNSTFASILPITSSADHVYVGELPGKSGIQGFIQAEVAPMGSHVWQILNLCLNPDLDRFGAGTALLDQLFNEGLQRGVSKFIVRLPLDDPIGDLFRARGFTAYATEHALLAESLSARPAPPLSGWRAMRREDAFGVYLVYAAVTPRQVAAVEANSFAEWRHIMQETSWRSRVPRAVRQRRFVVDLVQVVGWMGVSPGSGGRPHTLSLLSLAEPKELLPALIDRSLAYVAQHHPGPVWCSLRQYHESAITLLKHQGFEVIASQTLMVRELALKVPARLKVGIRDKRLVPQYG
ncbi:MAG: GNAT family N-acetyltransferase [Chloroflexi bacterium]|nr:MAG: GNAT family N-acetyltransferase [Chloroflexota bacterium]